MALPEKVLNKPCKDCENKEIKVKEESETEIKELNVEDNKNMVPKEETPAEDESERKENIKPSLGSKKSLLESIPAQPDQEKEANIKKQEEKENSEDKDSDTARAEESLGTEVDAEEEQTRSG
ncbi:hypothetical protein A6R68_09450 [Neotoma lepida]|uniref:Uncharacterized protein n=1 Tax=Neotoma lepida TaxID=56216 RepID=A0A1A6FZU1_NEOLE|nr:hypothetical protein A6R68_09450 [Neotoma lepida]